MPPAAQGEDDQAALVRLRALCSATAPSSPSAVSSGAASDLNAQTLAFKRHFFSEFS